MGGQGAVCDALHRARHGPDGPDGTGASYVDRSEGDLSAYDGDVDEFTSAWTAGVDD
jgi:hypothetical protein